MCVLGLCNNTPRAVELLHRKWSCKFGYVQSSKGCRYVKPTKTPQQQQQSPNPDHRLSFHSPLRLHLSVAWIGNKCKNDKARRSIWLQVLRSTDAMNINSIGCIQLYFRLNRACGRTCNVEKGLGPLHRPAFPRGNKSSCGRPGACQSKAILIMAKSWIRFEWTRREALRKASKMP